VVAEAFGVLDVREDRRERVVLLCFRNEPLKDWEEKDKRKMTVKQMSNCVIFPGVKFFSGSSITEPCSNKITTQK